MSILGRYSLFELVRMAFFVIRTKFLFRQARIIRFPIDVRGRRYISVSKGFTSGRYCRLEAYPQKTNASVINIGKNVQMNDYVHITAMKNVSIGDNVLMASKIYISDCTHGLYNGGEQDSSPEEPPINREYSMSEVKIEDNVWIGESVSILPGVSIGRGAIIGANSVVTKNIDSNCIAVGNPAKVVKRFDMKLKKWKKVE